MESLKESVCSPGGRPEPVCSYWDTNKGAWSSEGCRATGGSDGVQPNQTSGVGQTTISCVCDHLTEVSHLSAFSTQLKLYLFCLKFAVLRGQLGVKIDAVDNDVHDFFL